MQVALAGEGEREILWVLPHGLFPDGPGVAGLESLPFMMSGDALHEPSCLSTSTPDAPTSIGDAGGVPSCMAVTLKGSILHILRGTPTNKNMHVSTSS